MQRALWLMVHGCVNARGTWQHVGSGYDFCDADWTAVCFGRVMPRPCASQHSISGANVCWPVVLCQLKTVLTCV